MSCASDHQHLTKPKGAIVPNQNENFIHIFVNSKLHAERWTLLLKVEHEGQFRYVVGNEAGTHITTVQCLRDEYYATDVPVTMRVAEADAKGILFNRGSAVPSLKAAAAGFLVLMQTIRDTPKFAHPYPYQNQTDEGV